jgi:HAD superfamily hydrolase (TIGR01549 family)
MAKPYRLILFDCFNTLFVQDPSRLPRLELDGRTVISTAGLLLEPLRALDPTLGVEAVHHAQRGAWRWAEQERGPELREVPAPRRFRHACEALGLVAPDEALVQALLDVHMRALTDSFAFPPAHRQVLSALRAQYRLGLFSNFDHAPALHRLLRETGIVDWFDPLLVSDGLGYRKPGAAAFDAALRHIGLPPGAILFVGDSLEDDVAGARGAGLDVAWLNPKGAAAPESCRPTYELASLLELPALLEP